MPTRPPIYRPPGARNANPTDRHKAYNRARPASDALYGTLRWKETRALKFRLNPLCEPCQARGRTTLAALIHHKRPVRQFGTEDFFDLDGLESVCAKCHAEKHASR